MNFVPLIYRPRPDDDDDEPPEPPPLWLVGVVLMFLAVTLWFAFANMR